jgi:hypothetical protein
MRNLTPVSKRFKHVVTLTLQKGTPVEEVYAYTYNDDDVVDKIAISMFIDKHVQDPDLSLTALEGEWLKAKLFQTEE